MQLVVASQVRRRKCLIISISNFTYVICRHSNYIKHKYPKLIPDVSKKAAIAIPMEDVNKYLLPAPNISLLDYYQNTLRTILKGIKERSETIIDGKIWEQETGLKPAEDAASKDKIKIHKTLIKVLKNVLEVTNWYKSNAVGLLPNHKMI